MRALDTSSVVLVNHGDLSLIVEIKQLPKMAEVKTGLSQRDHKKLVADCRCFRTLTKAQKLSVLFKLRKAHSDDKLFGWSFGRVRFHYIRDYTRLRHIFGLADAVSLACESLNFKVLYPAIISRGVPLGTFHSSHSRISTYVDDSKGYPTLKMRIRKKKMVSSDTCFRLVLHYLRVFPKGLEEKDYVKLIKLSLAGTFSFQMNQDTPPGYLTESVPLFPSGTQARLDRVLGKRKKRRCQFYFNLLQSKSLCAPVGEDMIQEAYEKHYASLCRREDECIPRDHELYQKLKSYGSKVGRVVKELYDPHQTSLPNTRACIEGGRNTGGNLNALKQDGTLISSSGDPVLDLTGDSENPRVEPFVIGLFGPPGSGKTTSVAHLVQKLRNSIAPSLSRENFVYSRSCSTKHWDGYNGQPVVVLDDFGQDLSDTADIAEFMTLVSLNDYVLPMAELSQKGTKFTSPIVIVTTNMGFGTPFIKNGTSGNVIEDPLALWRRFDLPLLTTSGDYGRTTFTELKMQERVRQHLDTAYYKKHNIAELHWTQVRHSGYCNLPRGESWGVGKSFTLDNLFSMVDEHLRRKCDFHVRTFHNSWTQFVGSYFVRFSKDDGPLWNVQLEEDPLQSHPHTHHLRLEFPREPPLERPVVKASAISEALKVRMITVGEKDTKVLQPFQKALWTYLGTLPQFCLTNGVKELDDFVDETLPWFERIERKIQQIQSKTEEGDLWLSGDYTAATDNFPMWATQALVEGILEHIEHQPTREWVRWEISSHKMLYPQIKKEGIQTSGQLMGSLLSFPLLCFLNDFVVSEAGFSPDKYLVNGDDVVARGSSESIETWKNLAPRVGLSLSLGKNFIDRNFCTVNSQLFFDGTGLPSGKLSCQNRTNSTLSYCLSESQYYWGLSDQLKENFVMRNWRELSKTPRSIHLGRDHGGLGLADTSSHISIDVSLAKRVYLYDALKRYSKPILVSGHPYAFVRFPEYVADHIKERYRSEVPSNVELVNRCKALSALTPRSEEQLTEKFSDLSHRDLRDFETSMGVRGEGFRPAQNLCRTMVKDGGYNINEAPELSFLNRESRFLAVDKKIADMIQNRILYWAIHEISRLWQDTSYKDDPFFVESPDFLELENIEFLLEDIHHFALDEVLLFEDPLLEDSFYHNARRMDCSFWKTCEAFLHETRPVKVRDNRVHLMDLFTEAIPQGEAEVTDENDVDIPKHQQQITATDQIATAGSLPSLQQAEGD